MRKTGFIIILLFAGVMASAQSYKMAAGVRFSTADAIVNNSISFKYFFTPTVAGEAMLSFGDPLALGLLFTKHNPIGDDTFTFFYGGGAYVSASSDYRVGLHGVAGLDYKLPSIPLNLALDWKPELNLSKQFSFEPAALGLTARFTIQ